MIKENSPKQLELLKQFDDIVKAWGKYPTVDDLQSKFKIYGKIRYNFGNYGNLIDEYELWRHSSEVFEDRYEEANNTLEEDSVFLKEIYKYKNLLKYERKNKDLLLKQITSQENIYDYICQNMPVINYNHITKKEVCEVSHIEEGTAVLHLSDLHYGEVVQFGNTIYDCAIAEARFSSIISQFCNIVKNYKKAVVFINGDIVNGSIHDEFKSTNEFVVTDCVIRLNKIISESLILIREYMPKDGSLSVVFTVGNHGRTIPGGVYYKNKVKENWDYVLGKFVEQSLLTTDIDVEVCATPSILYNIEDLRFAVTHGDCFKSLNNIRMGVAKFQEMNMSTIGSFDHLLIGHFHSTQIMNGLGGKIFVNGSFKECDEYSVGNLYQIVPPEQTVLIVKGNNISNIIILNAND